MVRSAECALQTQPLQGYLCNQPLMFEFLLRKPVVEKHVTYQHHINPSDTPFLHIDTCVVILVVISVLQVNLGTPSSELLKPQGWLEGMQLKEQSLCQLCSPDQDQREDPVFHFLSGPSISLLVLRE